MIIPSNTALVASLVVACALAGCKQKSEDSPAPAVITAPAAVAPATTAAGAAVASAPAAPIALAGQQDAVAIEAELTKIPVISMALPPFPFIDYPANLHPAHHFTTEHELDQVSLIVGDRLHTVEGKVKYSSFSLGTAKISEFQARRDYTKAALDMGGVKVNKLRPDEGAFIAANGGDESVLIDKTKFSNAHSYDVYFLPTSTGRKWLVLMMSDSRVRIIAIEEKQVATSVKLVPAAAMKPELDSKGHVP